MKRLLLVLLAMMMLAPFASATTYLSAYDSYKVLEMHMNQSPANPTWFNDTSASKHIFRTVGDAVSNISYKQFGNASLSTFTTGFINTTPSADFNFGTGDLTVMGWAYKTTTSDSHIWGLDGLSANYPLQIEWYSSDIIFYTTSGTAPNLIAKGSSLSLNAWHQLVLTRQGDVWSAYIDGVQAGSNLTNATAMPSGGGWIVGAGSAAGSAYPFRPFTGNVDELSVWKGVAIPIAQLYPQTYEVGQSYPTAFSNWAAYGDAWKATNDTYTNIMWNATGSHSWLATGNASNVTYLVVAGGGTSGYAYSGGAGAGGLLTGTSYSVSRLMNVTVGSGGPSYVSNGGNSSFNTTPNTGIQTMGGGCGNANTAGVIGGSGSGGSWHFDGASGVAGQGNSGGTHNGEDRAGQGGGGAGSAGYANTGSNSNGGAGGAGKLLNITGSSVWYAAGGGGGSSVSCTQTASGGTGGGGNGGCGSLGGNGTTYGSGGGGGSEKPASTFYNAGYGMSGVIIIQFQTGGEPSVTPPVISSFTANATTSAVYAMPVTFTDTSTGTPTTWNWSFGNGNTSTLQNPTTYFSVSGQYPVYLNVTNATGAFSNVSSVTITLSSDNDANLKSWMHFNSSATSDEMGNVWTAAGGAVFTASPVRFGGGSLSLQSNDARVTTPSSTNFNFGTGDFTLEFWINPTTPGSGANIISRTTGNGAGTTSGWGFYNGGSTSTYSFWMGSLANATPTFSLANGAWQHVSIQRKSGTILVGVNGTLVATNSQPGNFDTTNPIYIGRQNPGTETNLYLDEFRISNVYRWGLLPFPAPNAQYLGLVGSLADRNQNSTLRYKTNPGDAAPVYNQTGGGYRNRTPQIQNITSANNITFSMNFDPLAALVNAVYANKTNYADMSIVSSSVDNTNGIVTVTVARTNQNNPITALFDNRTNLADLQMLYYNYTPADNVSTYFTNANIGDNNTMVLYPVHNFIMTPVSYGRWSWFPNFTADNTAPTTSQVVTFTDSTVGYPNVWNYSFGDGQWGNGTTGTATHTYGSSGLKTVTQYTFLWQNNSINNVTTRTNYINVGITPNFTQQDIWQAGSYVQTFTFIDSITRTPILIVVITDSNGQTFTTTNGTGYLTEPAGSVAVYFSASGYAAAGTSYVIDSDATHAIQLTPSTTGNTNTALNLLYPRDTFYRFVDRYNNNIVGANVSVIMDSSTIDNTNWLTTLLGLSTSATPMNNGTELFGRTDSKGEISFPMIPSGYYKITVTNATEGISYTTYTHPDQVQNTIVVVTAGSAIAKNQADYINATLYAVGNNTDVNVLLYMNFNDTSGATTAISYYVNDANKTLLSTTQYLPPYTFPVVAYYSVPNAKAAGYVWGYYANNTLFGNVSGAQGITLQGKTGVMINIDPCGGYATGWGDEC